MLYTPKMGGNDLHKKGLAKAMAFLGGTLTAMDRDAAEAASERGISFVPKHNYKAEVEQMINKANIYNQQPVQNMPVEQIPMQMPLAQSQPVYYQQQMPIMPQPVQTQYQTYYQQPVTNNTTMPDISNYIKSQKKQQSNQATADSNLVAAIQEANKPLYNLLDIACQLLGRIYDEQQRMNVILNSATPIDEVQYEEDNHPTEPAQITYKTPEEEIAELEKLSAAMMPEDITNPSVLEDEITM